MPAIHAAAQCTAPLCWPLAPLMVQLPSSAPTENRCYLKYLVPCHSHGDPNGVPDSWHWPGTALDVARIWEVNTFVCV